MTTEFRALFIHGVGRQGPGFADEARRNLRAACKDRGVAVDFESVHWAPFADAIENLFLAAVKAKGSAGNLTQRESIGTLADAIMYCRYAPLQEQIFGLIDTALERFGAHPHCVFAHSLGALIATDYLRTRGMRNCTKLVTLGCNIGLFTLGSGFAPVPGLSDWLNLWDDDDFLGWPVAITEDLAFVRDHQVNVGITGLAHTKYWDDHALWSATVPKLLFG